MNYQHPDRINIKENFAMIISPQYIEIVLTIEGNSIAFTNEALKKAKELVFFIEQLEKIGINKQDISLENVLIRASSGKLFTSSQAEFTIKITKVKLELIPSVLDLVAQQKNIEVSEMEYIFADLSKEKSDLLKQVAIISKEQAKNLCETLGVELIGVYSMNPRWTEPSTMALNEKYSESGKKMSKSISPSEFLGLHIVVNHKGILSLSLEAEYRVSEFRKL